MSLELEEEITGADELLYRMDALRFVRDRLKFKPDAKQAEVMSGTVRRGLLNCTRQWGKSTITAAMAVHRAWTSPESLTIAVSPSARQTGEFLRKASTFVRELGIRPRGDGDNEISLLFPNGARIVGLPGSESTVRGFSAVGLMLIDEAARVNDDLYRAVRPFLAASDGDLWLMSTPCGKRGFFYEAWTNGGPQWERFTVTGADCPRIGRRFLEEERVANGERSFRQEYLCEFVDVDQSLFSRDTIDRAFSREVRPLVLSR
jgi:hypothetical protein